MALIQVRMEMAAPPEPIFELLTDHAGYGRFTPIFGAKLLRQGQKERNGLGALRELRGGLITFHEEIVGYEPPRRFDYLIRWCNFPIQHEHGFLLLTPKDNKNTEVLWESKFELNLPLLGGMFSPVAAFGGHGIFRQILLEVKALVEKTAAETVKGSS